MDSHIGFISIKNVEAELKAHDVAAESDYIKFQEIAYGRKECAEKLRKQIALAGNRYKPELDVPNQSFETLFANLWDIRNLEKHKKILRTGKQVFLSLQKQILRYSSPLLMKPCLSWITTSGCSATWNVLKMTRQIGKL